jgi:hypothetical protein
MFYSPVTLVIKEVLNSPRRTAKSTVAILLIPPLRAAVAELTSTLKARPNHTLFLATPTFWDFAVVAVLEYETTAHDDKVNVAVTAKIENTFFMINAFLVALYD